MDPIDFDAKTARIDTSPQTCLSQRSHAQFESLRYFHFIPQQSGPSQLFVTKALLLLAFAIEKQARGRRCTLLSP
jgi:hypothetical protein